jgi:hypothetical protein
MEIIQRLLLHLTGGFGCISAGTENRDEAARAAHRLVVGHVREAGAGHRRAPAACGIFE